MTLKLYSLIAGGVGTIITVVMVSKGLYDFWSIVGGIGCVAILVYGIFAKR